VGVLVVVAIIPAAGSASGNQSNACHHKGNKEVPDEGAAKGLLTSWWNARSS
jgi:hypothetical protein